MSRKHFSWLLVATLVLGVLVVLLPGRTSKESEFEVRTLIPGLAEQVNNVDQVEVVKAGNATVATLQRQDDRWVVAEFGAYPADWPQLRGLLANLAQAEVIELKTANPEYFSRLGVSDVANDDSQATLLRLSGAGIDSAVLVGNAADGREGQYVRLEGGDQALLVNQALDIPATAKDWLQRDIVDIADAEVVEVEVLHADGSQVRALKTSADDDDFVLQDIPQGREVLSAWSVNSMANALAKLQLDAVARVDTVDFSNATKFRLLTADGLEVLAEIAEVAEAVPAADGDDPAAEAATKTWLKLAANAYETGDAETAETAEATGDTDSTGVMDGESPVAEEPADEDGAESTQDAGQRAAEINRRVQGWAFEIPSYKADAMTKEMDELLKALPVPE
ncbi:MAG TPA: DUF4340 domain-containing protein [Xanthomonadales bacterium]|nr:DUF4340 domain-containing protein [Xanthomonadales bacterium]